MEFCWFKMLEVRNLKRILLSNFFSWFLASYFCLFSALLCVLFFVVVRPCFGVEIKKKKLILIHIIKNGHNSLLFFVGKTRISAFYHIFLKTFLKGIFEQKGSWKPRYFFWTLRVAQGASSRKSIFCSPSILSHDSKNLLFLVQRRVFRDLSTFVLRNFAKLPETCW